MSMFRSPHDADIAASQVRTAAHSMNSLVSELNRAGTWVGDDASRFGSEWNTAVTQRLLLAAQRIDNLDFGRVGE